VTTEAGGTAQFTVVLTSAPLSAVTISLHSSDETEGTVEPSRLTFLPYNWNVPQTVTVTGVKDQVADGNVPYQVVLESSRSFDSVYEGIDPADVSVTNLDSASLDIDGNGKVEPLLDGIILLRYLFGFAGRSLVRGALGDGATRTEPTQITAMLDTVRTSMLDVDANGKEEGLMDGILLLRYLFGFRGKALVRGALGENAQRTQPEAVAAFLADFYPPSADASKAAPAKGPAAAAGGSIAFADLVVPSIDASKATIAIHEGRKSSRHLDGLSASCLHDSVFAAENSDWTNRLPSANREIYYRPTRHDLGMRRLLPSVSEFR
jgi:hypothetical protein